jgi:hypothetical protein
MRRPYLFDGRRLIEPSTATDAGLHFRGVGRRPQSPVAVEAG